MSDATVRGLYELHIAESDATIERLNADLVALMDAFNDQAAELERLTEKLASYERLKQSDEANTDRLVATIERLRAALEEYQHLAARDLTGKEQE